MTKTHHAVAFGEEDIDRCLTRYSGDGAPYRVLMHLWTTAQPATMGDLLVALRVHRTRVRRALRMLIGDGLIVEGDDGGRVTYALAQDASIRSWVSQLLRRAIHERLIGRGR